MNKIEIKVSQITQDYLNCIKDLDRFYSGVAKALYTDFSSDEETEEALEKNCLDHYDSLVEFIMTLITNRIKDSITRIDFTEI